MDNGAKHGAATVTAATTDGSCLTASCTVTVPEPLVLPETIEMSEKAFRLNLGQSHQLVVTTPGAGDLIWSSSDDTIASVDTAGQVTAHRGGIAIITATAANGASVWCAVFCYLPGDVDENDNVDANDVNRVVNIVLGK